MSQTKLELRTTLDIFLSDPKNQKWTTTHKDHFINQALQDIISSENIPYIRVAELPIRDGEYEYEFPADMLEPVAMMFQSIEGSIIISSSWRSLMVNYDVENSLTSFDTSVFWQAAANASGHITIRDIVSDNKFIFSPKYQAELYNYNVHEQATLPSAAVEDEIWVDTYESENLVYQCSETYNSIGRAVVDVDSSLLAGDTDLRFSYDVEGLKYVQVVFVDGGASGTSSLAPLTGDADDINDPLTYTYTLYDDNSSNNDIIAIPAANMTVSGADATDGTVTPSTIPLLLNNYASVTLSSDYLPSATDLVFTYNVAGVKYAQVVLVDGGDSGVAIDPVVTGDADDRADPLTYTYTIYDDTTNDDIIALTAANLTVTGSDATSAGDVVATSADLVNDAASKWTQQVIHLRYVAIFPKMSTDTDTLPDELPVLIREGDCIPYIAASKMLEAIKGDERLLIMARTYKSRAKNILERCREHRAGNGPPYDVEPS